jgi:MoaA/NifB/PqqE/SkfB family radical SAM enzyme
MPTEGYNKNCSWKDIPDIGMIELTNCCNFSCIMCSNMKMRRKKGFMKYETFKKALDRCKEAGITEIKLYATGESLMHPEFMKFWNLAITYPFDSIMISTNGQLLTQKVLMEVVKSPKLRIQFSFSGWDKRSYELRYKPGKFSEAIDKIKLAAKIIEEAGLAKDTLTVNGVVGRKAGAIEKSKNLLRELGLSDSQIDIHHLNNWDYIVDADAKGYNLKKIAPKHSGKYYCHIANTRIGILYDGSITACGCIDVNGELLIGNIFDDSIKEARAGKLFSDFKEKLNTGNVSSLICSRCESLKSLR